jgi:hypothetical protein
VGAHGSSCGGIADKFRLGVGVGRNYPMQTPQPEQTAAPLTVADVT